MRTEFVAEFTTNHMGNLNLLLEMVVKAKESGASLIKMQKKDVKTFYTKEKLEREYLSPYGKTYLDYRKIFEFNQEDFLRMDLKCKEIGIDWFSTVQDIPSLEFLLPFDLSTFKIASSRSKDIELLSAIRSEVPQHKRIVVSLGGATLHEVENIVNFFKDYSLVLLHCVAEYPCPNQRLRLGNILRLHQEFASPMVKIGYSGHEEGISPSIAAVDLGAEMIERHFCLSKHSFVHHIECSLEPKEFKQMVSIAKSGESLSHWYKELDKTAFESMFGMSKKERDFLIDQKYGSKYITKGSYFEK